MAATAAAVLASLCWRALYFPDRALNSGFLQQLNFSLFFFFLTAHMTINYFFVDRCEA